MKKQLYELAFGVAVVSGAFLVALPLIMWAASLVTPREAKTCQAPLAPPSPFAPMCEDTTPPPTVDTEDFVRPSSDGERFELHCGGQPTVDFSCPPADCPYRFRHPSLAVSAAVTVEVCDAPFDPSLVLAVIAVESAGNVAAISHAGARGLMQLMPATAAEVAGLEYYDGIEFNPTQNVRLGVRYLEMMLHRYDGNTDYALTAYHRGPRNTDAILAREGKLPEEIKAVYADKVQRKRWELSR